MNVVPPSSIFNVQVSKERKIYMKQFSAIICLVQYGSTIVICSCKGHLSICFGKGFRTGIVDPQTIPREECSDKTNTKSILYCHHE